MARELFPVDYYNPPRASTLDSVEAAILALRGIGRGERYSRYMQDYEDSVAGEPPNIQSLSEAFARRVASRHNKNILALCFGDAGTGKSMSLCSLALGCSKWLAKLIGGKPTDYWNFKEGISIIDPEMLQEKISTLRKHQILICDDAGPAYDARNAMSKDNKDLNYILQTCRTQNNIILFSSIHQAMLDISSRRIAGFFMETAEVRHDVGVTALKVFHLVRDMKQGKIFYKYPTKGRYTVVRYTATLPPPGIKKQYDRVREEQGLIMLQRRNERKAKEEERSEKVHRDKFTAEEFRGIMDKYVKNPVPTTLRDICLEIDLGDKALDKYMKKHGYTTRKIPNTKKCVIVKATA